MEDANTDAKLMEQLLAIYDIDAKYEYRKFATNRDEWIRSGEAADKGNAGNKGSNKEENNQ